MGDAWETIAPWVAAKRKEGLTPDDVAETLGLNLLAARGQDEETRWVLTAMAAAQYRSLTQPRARLSGLAGISHIAELLKTCTNIMVIAGSGLSPGVSGYEAFWDGLTERGKVPHAAALFEPGRFVHAPLPLLSYISSLLPGTHAPSLSHRFLRELERRGKLQRVYTQNIDGLERQAGLERIVHCHGSPHTASCVACRHQVQMNQMTKDLVGATRAPRCQECAHELNLLKPDVALIGESSSSLDTEAALREDLPVADLVLVMGSAVAVDPLRHVPPCLAPSIPQIVIGPAAPSFDHEWDLQLLGDCDVVVRHLCDVLGWTDFIEEADPGASRGDIVCKPEGGPGSAYRFTAAGQASPDKLPPAQTPLATKAKPSQSKPTQRAQKRWGLSLAGATASGSGAGARGALANAAPIVDAASAKRSVDAESQEVAPPAPKRAA